MLQLRPGKPTAHSESRLLRLVMALAIGSFLFGLTSSDASAQAPTQWGDGSVSCSFSATITFSPPLTKLGGGTNPSRLRTVLSGCTTQGYASLNTIVSSGKLSGYFAKSPFSCVTRSATGAAVTGVITWAKGSVAGRATAFQPSTIQDGAVSASFAGSARVALSFPTSRCDAHKVRSASVTGTFTVGPSCGPGSGALAFYPIAPGLMCGGVYGPTSITAGPDGALWFTAPDANTIGRITTSGAVSLYKLPGHYTFATSITAGPDGALWFSDQASAISNTSVTGATIGRITTTGAVTLFPVSSCNPEDITGGPGGALWFLCTVPDADPTGDSIDSITTSGTVTVFSGSGFDHPSSITAGPDGALWFTNGGHWTGSAPNLYVTGQSIGQMTTSGVIATYTDPGIGNPSAMTTGPDGAMWFLTGGGVGRITTSGAVTSYPEPAIPGLYSLAAGPDGALWFTNYGRSIGRITTSGVLTNTYDDPSVSIPYDIAAGPDGAVWFANYGSDTIGRIPAP